MTKASSWLWTASLSAALLSGLAVLSASKAQDRPPRPTQDMLNACEDKSSGQSCSASGPRGETISGSCFAPGNRPLACVPEGGPAAFRSDPGRRPNPLDNAILADADDTSAVLCSVTEETENAETGLTSEATWWCGEDKRNLVANGVPDHSIGNFPNRGNPHGVSAQYVRASVPLYPALIESSDGQPVKIVGYALNGVKFDPGTAGRCPSSAQSPADCSLGFGRGHWHIEALGQDSFNFGEDHNHAHVQPSGAYHYHGVPEGLLSDDAKAGLEMALIGWATDGFPIYARYGYGADGALREMQPSYQLKEAPDAGRPDTADIPMGAFSQDYEYVAGLGDLDECNGRIGATPDFPGGIYHYYATDAYPFIQRCVKGISERQDARPRQGQQRGGGRPQRPPRP
ncbi:MAG: YHYH protein [Pseudomonadota bacterium]